MIRAITYILCVLFVIVVSTAQAYALDTETPSAENQEELVEAVDILPTDAISLGKKEENGVLAMAWLYRVPDSAISESSSKFPYLLFVRFLSVENNILIEKGLVAYKLEGEADKITPAEKMEPKNSYFVAGINSPWGYSSLHIGCKMEDEKKRQFEYVLK